MAVQRLLSAYSNHTDLLVWQLPVPEFPLQELQKVFGVTEARDPMLDSWSVLPRNVPFLERFLENPHGWDFESLSYFLEAEASS